MIDHLNHVVSTSWSEWMGGSESATPEISWVLVSNGGTAYHDNVILFGSPTGQGKPSLVVKVCRIPVHGWTLRAEYEHLTTLWGILGPKAEQLLPRPIALLEHQKDIALVINYVEGSSLLFASRRDLWMHSGRLRDRFTRAAKVLRLIHEETAKLKRAAGSEKDGFNRKAESFTSIFDLSDDELREVEELKELVASRMSETRAAVLIQGDFWHGNIIEGGETNNLTLVDWQFARWSPDASQDVYLYLLAGAVSAVPYGSPDQRAVAAVSLLERWRVDLIPAYLEAYGNPEDYMLLPLREGALACTIEMATRPQRAFNSHHEHDDALWRAMFAQMLTWPDEGSKIRRDGSGAAPF
jgi:hypothetical protein